MIETLASGNKDIKRMKKEKKKLKRKKVEKVKKDKEVVLQPIPPLPISNEILNISPPPKRGRPIKYKVN